MSTALPSTLLRIRYEQAAQAYLRSLPLEHFMQATAQATQRKITLESLDLVHARRPDVQVFNELLVQYPRPRRRKPGQVVPDNMVVICPETIQAGGSFDLPLQPVGPLWVLEYVSVHNQRKDYKDNFQKYERQLKVPYYLLFHPERQKLTLYQHTGKKYVKVQPNQQGRFAIVKLDLEVAILDHWVRYWYRGELLPLPADLLRDLEEARRNLDEARGQLAQERQARLAAERELDSLRARLEQRHDKPLDRS